MKNLKPYKYDAFEFHKKVVSKKRNSKKDPDFVSRVVSLNDTIEEQYKIFYEKFIQNELEKINNKSFSRVEKETLIKLYSFKSKVIQELKINLTTDERNRIINTCQNCTISEVNSFDHFIPKDEFAEFVVNPLNLFPSCTTCNSLKSSVWRKNNKRLFLNLYLDQLPKEQYLFVDIKFSGEDIDLTYNLKNNYGIDSTIFELIVNHYNKLNLLQRFKENSDAIVSEFEISIKSYMKRLSIGEIKQTIIEKNEDYKKVYGYNYWKSILEMSLINNDEFINRLKTP
jgi:5-methylcytosine-specific restriction endonuclease McrA